MKRKWVVAIILFSLIYVLIMASQNTVLTSNVRKGGEKYFKQKGWDGLPISTENFLYVKITEDTFNKIWDLEQTLKHMEYPNHAWRPLFDRYYPQTGFNGILNALNDAFDHIGQEDSETLHQLGEYIAEKSVGYPQYAIEVSARKILHKAPLHGVVWSFIRDFPRPENLHALFSFINTELCYFDNSDDFYSIWISCAHGVGHGLGKLYRLEGIDKGMQVCGYHEDHDFVYACATGVIMELGSENGFDSSSREPCDSVLQFPAACYRFKSDYFRKTNLQYPCEGVNDEYHLRGCLFGEGYTSESQNVCWKYNPNHHPELLVNEESSWIHFVSCMDGIWQTNSHMNEESCFLFEYTPAFNACLFRLYNSSKWNWSLLEISNS